MTVPLPKPPARQRSWFPRNRARLGLDLFASVALILLEGQVLLWLAFAAGMQAWATRPGTPSTAATPTEDHRIDYLLYAALVAAAVAALRRARWTAGSQLAVACALAVMATSAQHDYDQQRQQQAAGRSASLTAQPADTAAAAITADLNGDLNGGFLSPGHTYGGPFTQGTVVDQVEAHAGVVLSMGSTPTASGLTQTTVAVMLDPAPPPDIPACYSYTFTITHGSAHDQPIPCPGTATTQLGQTLLAQNETRQAAAPDTYPVTAAGVRTLLRDHFGPAAATLPIATATTSATATTPVLVAAVRIHGICHFVRLGTSTTITTWVPLWQAPLDDQPACDTTQALAADTLYGTDPAQEG
ncbi:hypothetical protein EDD99_6447 [Streptomyces sp. 846.5]|nr:DUF6234 family protein [Streptomyces sp. 846.5]TDT98228.1 hypothetical protein EDD99_6447 [Streptomyces sp. 846.5]